MPQCHLPTCAYGNIGPSPAVGYGGTIYVGAGDGKLYAINPNGSVKWSVMVGTTPAESAVNPAVYVSPWDIDGRPQTIYIGTSDYRLCKVVDLPGVPPTSPTWCYTNPYSEPVCTTPAIADLNADGQLEIIFTSTSSLAGHVYAITDMGASSTVLWTTTIGPTGSSPAIGFRPVAPPYQYKVFVGSIFEGPNWGIIYTLAGWNGTILDQFTAGGFMVSSPAVAQRMDAPIGAPWVFATSNDALGNGKLYAFGPPSKFIAHFMTPEGEPYPFDVIISDGEWVQKFDSVTYIETEVPNTATYTCVYHRGGHAEMEQFELALQPGERREFEFLRY